MNDWVEFGKALRRSQARARSARHLLMVAGALGALVPLVFLLTVPGLAHQRAVGAEH